MEKSYEYYEKQFRKGVFLTKETKYDSVGSVRKNNQGVDKYRKAAKTLGLLYPDKITEFAKLLLDEDQDVRIACAVCLLTVIDAQGAVKEGALDVIRKQKEGGSSFEKMVWRLWMRDHGFPQD